MTGSVTPNEIELADYLSQVSFLTPQSVVPSAWHEHVPFAFWAVENLRPRRIVELGTHNGLSFFGFCQAVSELGIDCDVVAVDTWQGDDHAGLYGEDVYQEVQATTLANFPTIGRMLRATFDDALAEIPDESVDLLHIDGRHFEEDVRHDFESWIPKLSRHAVVLFHDTQVRERGFGVYRYWEELVNKYPTFEFRHGHGLGVLVAGEDAPADFTAFISRTGDDTFAETVRQAYSQLGRGASAPYHRQRWQDAEQLLRVAERRLVVESERYEVKLQRARDEITTLRAELSAARGEAARLRGSRWWRAGKPVRSASTIVRKVSPKARS